MFHGKHPETDALGRVAAWAGLNLTPDDRARLDRYARWLREEAAAAGGIGPDEAPRVLDRHVADSLTFAYGWVGTPEAALDVGSGVGLPGIPLAITHPSTTFTLLDRSGRRCELARRAIRILDLPNVVVVQTDAERIAGTWPIVLFRASLTPKAALAVAEPLLNDGGWAVIGLSRRTEPPPVPAAPGGARVDLVRTDPGVLDSPAWLLRMERTEPRSKDGDPA